MYTTIDFLKNYSQDKTLKLIFIDFETGGLDPLLCGIVQTSFIVEYPFSKLPILHEYDIFSRPPSQKYFCAGALEVNNINFYDLPEINLYKFLSETFQKYIDKFDKKDKFYFIGYRSSFDYSFLSQLWKDNNDTYLNSFINKYFIDVLEFVKLLSFLGFHPYKNFEGFKLIEVCKALEISINAHDSLSDIRATRILFYKCIDTIARELPGVLSIEPLSKLVYRKDESEYESGICTNREDCNQRESLHTTKSDNLEHFDFSRILEKLEDKPGTAK